MNTLRFSLFRSTSMLSGRALAPRLIASPLQFVRFKSATSKPTRLFSPFPRKLEVAVTPQRVKLTFAEVPAAPVAPKTSTSKSLKDSIEEKIKKGLAQMKTKATKAVGSKVAGSVKTAKTTAAPKMTKSSKEKSSTIKHMNAVPCWVDASTTHIAVLIGNQYKVFALNNGWESKSRDINWAETAAFELLAQILAQQGRTGVVQVNSDSATALRAMSGGRVRVPEIMESARRTDDILETSMFAIKGVKVCRTTNLADKFTRGKTVDGYEQMKGDIVVPEALVPYVTVV